MGERREERSRLGEYAFGHPFLSSTLPTTVSLDRTVIRPRVEMRVMNIDATSSS